MEEKTNITNKETLKKIKQISIIGFFFIAIVGTLLHFLYAFSGNNILIGAISAVNESTWEHLKIAVVPIVLWSGIVEYVLLRKDKVWKASSVLIKIVTVMVTIVVLFYGYIAIFHHHNLVYDIVIFYVAIALAQYLGYQETVVGKINPVYEKISKGLVICMVLLFVIITYLPPKLGIFQDEITGNYGVWQTQK